MDALAAVLGRISVVAAFLTALLLSAALAANVAVLGLGYPPDVTRALFLQATPVICLFLSNLAMFLTFYGTYRLLRRKDEYQVRDDLKGHAADLPGRLQGVPAQAAGRACPGCRACLPSSPAG
jgi:hypothetical protein